MVKWKEITKEQFLERLLNYLILTNAIWVYYIIVLTPWLLTSVGMSFEQWSIWVIEGTPIELIVGYPLLRMMIYLDPRVKKFNKKLVERIFRKGKK